MSKINVPTALFVLFIGAIAFAAGKTSSHPSTSTAQAASATVPMPAAGSQVDDSKPEGGEVAETQPLPASATAAAAIPGDRDSMIATVDKFINGATSGDEFNCPAARPFCTEAYWKVFGQPGQSIYEFWGKTPSLNEGRYSIAQNGAGECDGTKGTYMIRVSATNNHSDFADRIIHLVKQSGEWKVDKID